MQLLIFRHGIAEDAEAVDKRDFDRALTRRGIERTTRAAHGLARVVDQPDAILTSPKVRAVQTARIVGEALDMSPEACDVIAEGSAADIHQMLRQRTEDRLIVVGHEPTLSELVEQLCVGARAQLRGFVDMKKAACAMVEGPIRRNESPGQPMLRWLLPPRVLRALSE